MIAGTVQSALGPPVPHAARFRDGRALSDHGGVLAVRPVSSRRPRARTRVTAAGVAALVVAGLLTGCAGGDGAEPDVAPAPPAAITVPPDAVIDGEKRVDQSPAPDATEDADATPSEEPSPEGEPAEGTEPTETAPDATAEAAAECAAVQTAWNQTNQALVNLSADHPRALVNSFRAAGTAMGSIEEVPDAIAAPWATMSGYLAKVNEAFEPVDMDDANLVAAAMAAAVTAADTQAATAAGQKITAFVSGGCAG